MPLIEVPNRMCKFFAAGSCKNGAACKFNHEPPTGGNSGGSGGGGGGGGSGVMRSWGSGGKGGKGGVAPPQERSLPICKFFQQGTCKHGDSCRFAHPSPGDAYAPPPVHNGLGPLAPLSGPLYSIDNTIKIMVSSVSACFLLLLLLTRDRLTLEFYP